MKKIICLFSVVTMLFSGTVMAAEPSNIEHISKMEEIVFEDEFFDVSPLQARMNNNITLNLVGMSTYLDFSNMGNDFDEALVEYVSSDIDVAIAWDGRILAKGVGEAQITIKYNELPLQVINVTVEEKISEELMESINQYSLAQTRALDSESEERLEIKNRAADMVSLIWRPTSNLVGWNGEMTFYANEYYWGIPYSQTPNQVDTDGFTASMSNSNFYTTYVRVNKDGSTTSMPMYGNDCSGFVSFAWGIFRTTTATFIGYPSIGDYSNLESGDAVVYRNNEKNEGHIILVGTNWVTPPAGSDETEPYLVCYEQTPYDAELTFHTYAQLERRGYKAISKFNQ